jgi:hypothetical protein
VSLDRLAALASRYAGTLAVDSGQIVDGVAPGRPLVADATGK